MVKTYVANTVIHLSSSTKGEGLILLANIYWTIYLTFSIYFYCIGVVVIVVVFRSLESGLVETASHLLVVSLLYSYCKEMCIRDSVYRDERKLVES